MSDKIRILYIGKNHGTSRHRADALRRLGHQVRVLDPWQFLPKGRVFRKIFGKLMYEFGPNWLEPYMQKKIVQGIEDFSYDLVWSDQCEFIGLSTAQRLRGLAPYLINYAVDDPFGSRDKKRFSLYLKSVKVYNLIVVVRKSNLGEAYALGARNVLHVFRSADEVAHQPLQLTPDDLKKWKSDVAFIGTWMPERGPFLARLIELNVPITIRGDRWHKAKEWPLLKKAWRGPAVVKKDYVKAIQTAKVCLGLLSKGNRDFHTTRSAEIPYIGSVLCAQRTEEHLSMYQDTKEALFWSTPEECAEKCFWLLNNPVLREQIAKAGQKRCRRNGFLNEPVMETIVNTAFGPTPVRVSSTKRIISEKRLCVQ